MMNPSLSQFDKPHARVDKNRRSQDDRGVERLGRLEARFDTVLPTLAKRVDIHATRTDMQSIISELHKVAGETHKWMLATVIGLFIGFGGLFLAMSNALKPEPQQPVVIQLPTNLPQIPN
ncbi:hypothetical protein SAMN04515618_101523 [Collimonas sp. OK307]|uniref:hypothetical protein n=1 Tax=Collimonas sp. OK307 TaxID=1801620 RepID=UPI0008ED2827|nr:hypothetical protein [Collimonas sp. OK307]SFH65979.1 hypothetical protein SAMN04515618_101523 [Collimonas sp. OK307]